MDSRIIESQKSRDVLPAFWARKLSRHITALLVKTPITPNQTTVLWGAISAFNSYLVYRVMIGELLWLPLIPLIYMVTFVLDCVDGEIARYKRMENPIAGKLLDGVCHRVTEYSLLAAFVLALFDRMNSPWVVAVGLLLMSGDAIYTYVYERRVTIMRVQIGFSGTMKSGDAVYERDEPWANLSLRRKIATFKGQIHYKSIYPVIALSYVSTPALFAGLALLGVYKHVAWIRLMLRTIAAGTPGKTRPASEPAAAAAPERSPMEVS